MGIDLVILVISRWGERVGRGNSVILCSRGRLAQRLAQVLYTHKAGGSNPSSPTKECEREGRVALAFLFSVRGFEPRSGRGAEEAVRQSGRCNLVMDAGSRTRLRIYHSPIQAEMINCRW